MTLNILCCGMNRTGTTSLHVALEQLGYRSAHYLLGLVDILNPPTDWDIFGDLEAISDGPWFHFWREIYEQHRCRMILTTRDPESWYNSMIRHIYETKSGDPVSNMVLFGCGYPKPRYWKQRFLDHEHAITSTIPPEDLLVMDLRDTPSWEPLCRFLERPIPETPFPWIP